MRAKRTQISAGLLALALSLSACAPMGSSSMPMGSDQTDTADSANFSPMDIMFAQMMIPHHQQALDMSQIASVKAEGVEVLELAAQISDEQGPEISQMRSWLSAAGAPEDMGHGSHVMDGMLTEEQMAALLDASGAEFDELFLKGMIAHHEGAIAMASMIQGSNNPEVLALYDSIVSSQQAQIESMKTLLGQ